MAWVMEVRGEGMDWGVGGGQGVLVMAVGAWVSGEVVVVDVEMEVPAMGAVKVGVHLVVAA